MNRPADQTRRQPSLARRLAVNVPVALLLVAVILLQLGLLKTLRVSSINMSPTLALDDHVVVRAWGSAPTRGDVVLYRSPFDYNHLQLGRIVAVAGDRVDLGEDGLHLEGRPVATAACDESAPCSIASDPEGGQPDDDCIDGDCLVASETLGDHTFFTRRAGSLAALMFPPTLVPEDHFFVLSDNRVDERDSRIYGAIPHGAVVGVLSFVYYAIDETGIRWDRISRRVS